MFIALVNIYACENDSDHVFVWMVMKNNKDESNKFALIYKMGFNTG